MINPKKIALKYAKFLTYFSLALAFIGTLTLYITSYTMSPIPMSPFQLFFTFIAFFMMIMLMFVLPWSIFTYITCWICKGLISPVNFKYLSTKIALAAAFTVASIGIFLELFYYSVFSILYACRSFLHTQGTKPAPPHIDYFRTLEVFVLVLMATFLSIKLLRILNRINPIKSPAIKTALETATTATALVILIKLFYQTLHHLFPATWPFQHINAFGIARVFVVVFIFILIMDKFQRREKTPKNKTESKSHEIDEETLWPV